MNNKDASLLLAFAAAVAGVLVAVDIGYFWYALLMIAAALLVRKI